MEVGTLLEELLERDQFSRNLTALWPPRMRMRLALFVFLVACCASEKVIYVGVDGDGDSVSVDTKTRVGSLENPASSLSHALTLIESGDTIVLPAGDLSGVGNCGLNISRSVIIQGAGMMKTILRCELYFVNFQGDGNWILQDLSVTDLLSSYASVFSLGSGKLALNSVRFYHNRRRSAASASGGAVSVSGASEFVLQSCVFERNSVEMLAGGTVAKGGAVYVESDSWAAYSSTFVSNFVQGGAAFGGAIASGSNTTSLVGMEACVFDDNSALAEDQDQLAAGGAIHFHAGNVTIYNVTFTNNSVDSPYIAAGGAIAGFSVLLPGNSLVITMATFTCNKGTRAAIYGGALSIGKGALFVLLCDFYYNSITQSVQITPSNSAGGAISVYFATNTRIFGCTFLGNSAVTSATSGSVSGAGVAVQSTPGATLFNCTFLDNTVFNTVATGESHGGCVLAGDGELIISSCFFTNCSAIDLVSSEASSSSSGGAIFVPTGNSMLTIYDSEFSLCSCAGAGGSLAVQSGSVNIFSTTFGNSTSRGDGGAVMISGFGGLAVFLDSTFACNESPENNGGAVTLNYPAMGIFTRCDFRYNSGSLGGAIFNGGNGLNVSRSTFHSNAAFSGGAIYTQSIGFFLAMDSIFSNNTASSQHSFTGGDGGAIYVDTGSTSTQISGCQFLGNLANTALRQSGGEVFAGGGAIHAVFISLTIDNCDFVSNTVVGCSEFTSSGLCFGVASLCLCGGGAVLVNSPVFPITNSRFIANTAGSYIYGTGRGGAVLSANGVAVVVLQSCVFERNGALEGGAWYVRGGGRVADCMFVDNDAIFGASILIADSVLDVIAPVSLCGSDVFSLQLGCSNNALVVGKFNMASDRFTQCSFVKKEQVPITTPYAQFYICANTSVSYQVAVATSAIAVQVVASVPQTEISLSIPGSTAVYPYQPSWKVHYPAYSRGAVITVTTFSSINTRATVNYFETQCLLSLNRSTVVSEDTLSTTHSAWSGQVVSLLVDVRDQFGNQFENRSCAQNGPLFLACEPNTDGFPKALDPYDCSEAGCRVEISVSSLGKQDIGLFLDGEFVPKFTLTVKSWAMYILLPLVAASVILIVVARQLYLLYRKRATAAAEGLLYNYSGGSTVMLDDDDFAESATFAIPIADIQILKEVASGAGGTVSLGLWHKAKVAVKRYHSMTVGRDVMNEARLHRSLNHPNIVQLFGICTSPLMTVMEWMHRGSLYHILHNKSVELSWSRKLELAIGASRGMVYLHNAGIIHRDLKSLNLLVDDTWVCKVCDFGLSRSFGPTMTIAAGTMLWTAPEVWTESGHYTARADVYSFGIVLWEILTREDPFADVTGPVLVEIVRKGKRPPVPPDCPAEYARVMQACWDADPDNRPSFVQVLDVLETLYEEQKTINVTSQASL